MTTPLPSSGAPGAVSYLRQRAGQELAEATSLLHGLGAGDGRNTASTACITRTGALAGALAAVGAIPEATAVGVLQELHAGLVRRGLLDADEPGGVTEPSGARPGTAVRAFPAGVSAGGAIDGFGFPVRMRFSAVVTDGQSAQITWRAAYDDPQLASRPRWQHEGPGPWDFLRRVTAADDLGGRYQVGSGFAYGSHIRSGARASFWWESWSQPEPAPPDEARWLEVTVPGWAPARIALDHAAEPAAAAAELDPAGAAGRCVDAGSVTLLAARLAPLPGTPLSASPASAVAVAADLLAAGVLPPGSPSLARLCAVARRRGLTLPGPLAAIAPAPLPAGWADLAGRLGREDGACGVVFPAAVLPEVDGVRCIITELVSRPDITTLRVFAPAWPLTEHAAGLLYGLPQHDARYHWDVRDDQGRRYATTAWKGGGSIDGALFPLRLHPPVSPQVRELEISLSGRTQQGSVRVPLDWQHDDWASDAPDWQDEP